MTKPSFADERLAALLDEEHRELDAFLRLLEREQGFLGTGEVDRLAVLAEEKAAAFSRLAAIGRRRAETLIGAGFGGRPEAFQGWLERLPADSPARARWKGLREAAARAHEMNRRNGELVRMRLAHNRQALNLLLALSDQAALYGPDGQAQPRPSGRQIDLA
ncbi:MAG: flagellar protein FlgN [Rhodocyclaceae bacterium]